MLPLKLKVPLLLPLIFTTTLPWDDPLLVTTIVSFESVPSIFTAFFDASHGSVTSATLPADGGGGGGAGAITATGCENSDVSPAGAMSPRVAVAVTNWLDESAIGKT